MADRKESSPIRVSSESGKADQQAEDTDLVAYLAAHEGDGRLFKMEVDYTSHVDDALPKADMLAVTSGLVAALDSLSSLEKQTRLGSDMRSNSRIVQHMVKLCFNHGNWALLNDTISILSKKRSIIKLAIARMVRDCCEMVDKAPNDEVKDKLIETLRTVTAGKIYVEIERARLTNRLVKKLEFEGKVDEAAAMLLELQVETYGSMDAKEKVEILLEQIRLCLLRSDFIRAMIIVKKISKRFFENKSEEVENLKLKYYDLLVEIALNEKEYLNLCRYCLEVYETQSVQANADKMKQTLKCVVLYALLAPHSNEQWDLLHRIRLMRKLEIIPEYKTLLELFINQEIIPWKNVILRQYMVLLRKGMCQCNAIGTFAENEQGDKRWIDFQNRVGEHNMRMIGKYYTQITFERLAELVDYPVDSMEEFLCKLIVDGILPDAKIHRPSRTVNLLAKKTPIERLDQWASSVRELTDIINKVSHLITKEEVVHRSQIPDRAR